MVRKGGTAHAKERKAIFPAVSSKTARDHWSAMLAASADEILDDITPLGEGDLFRSYAMRISGEALPKIFARLKPQLSGKLEVASWAFCGVLDLPCRWQA